MGSMNKIFDIWDQIEPNDKSPWLKLPCWAISFLSRYGIYDTDLHVLLYLFISAGHTPQEVYAPTCLATKSLCINDRVFFRSIKKLKGFGLNKTGNGRYDLTDLIKNLAKEKRKYNTEKSVILDNPLTSNILEGLE